MPYLEVQTVACLTNTVEIKSETFLSIPADKAKSSVYIQMLKDDYLLLFAFDFTMLIPDS